MNCVNLVCGSRFHLHLDNVDFYAAPGAVFGGGSNRLV